MVTAGEARNGLEASSGLAVGCLGSIEDDTTQFYIGVSKNSGTPKWMVYNGKSY